MLMPQMAPSPAGQQSYGGPGPLQQQAWPSPQPPQQHLPGPLQQRQPSLPYGLQLMQQQVRWSEQCMLFPFSLMRKIILGATYCSAIVTESVLPQSHNPTI